MNQTVLNSTHTPASGRLFAGVRYWPNNREALEASYSYAPNDIFETSACEHVNCGRSVAPTVARANFLAANYIRSFRFSTRFRPFVTAGVGLVFFHRVALNGVFEADYFTANLGGGIDVRLTRHWSLRMEDRDWLFEAPRLSDFVPDATGLTHNQVPSLGLVFRF